MAASEQSLVSARRDLSGLDCGIRDGIRDLSGLFEDAPRRLSHGLALYRSGFAMTVGWSVAADAPPVWWPAGLCLTNQESSDTLLVEAEPVDGHTWQSKPCRAVLEFVQDDHPRCEEYALRAMALRPELFDPDRIVVLADRMGWGAGLRKLCSMIDVIGDMVAYDGPRRCRYRFPDRMLAVSDMAPEPAPTEPWADVSVGFGPENLDRPWEDGHYDHRWRVRWLCDPWVLRQEIET